MVRAARKTAWEKQCTGATCQVLPRWQWTVSEIPIAEGRDPNLSTQTALSRYLMMLPPAFAGRSESPGSGDEGRTPGTVREGWEADGVAGRLGRLSGACTISQHDA